MRKQQSQSGCMLDRFAASRCFRIPGSGNFAIRNSSHRLAVRVEVEPEDCRRDEHTGRWLPLHRLGAEHRSNQHGKHWISPDGVITAGWGSLSEETPGTPG